ncbi:MAG: hypothetical protein JEZ02_18735 [Desulfatibacillum sp.]|nr:hypothetical protein [Desulfatibacillum sp.]
MASITLSNGQTVEITDGAWVFSNVGASCEVDIFQEWSEINPKVRAKASELA